MMHGKYLQYVLCGAKCVYCFMSRLYIMFLGRNLSGKSRIVSLAWFPTLKYTGAPAAARINQSMLLLMLPYHLGKLMVKIFDHEGEILNTLSKH